MSFINFGILLLLMVSPSLAGNFFATFPKEITSGVPFRVNLWLLMPNTATGGKSVTVALRSINNATQLAWAGSTMTVTVPQNQQTKEIVFEVPTTGLSPGAKLQMYLMVSGLKPTMETVTVGTPASSAFIQTNKPIYKPGETVHYRVLIVDPKLKPKKEAMKITINDKAGTTIQVTEVATSDKAVFAGQLELPDDLVLGEYEIKMQSSTSFANVKFKVDEYVLPMFDVEIELDQSYIISTSLNPTVSGTVKAMYTYGKGVSGQIVMSVNGRETTATQLIDGHHTFDIAATTTQYQSIITLKAEVKESGTGITREGYATVTIYRHAFKLSVVDPVPDTREFYLGKLTYSFFAKLTDPMDNLITDLSGYAKTLVYEYTDNTLGERKSTTISLPSATTSNPFRIDLAFPTTNLTLISIQLEVGRGNEEGEKTTFFPKKYSSSSGASLHLSLYDNAMAETVPPTETYTASDSVCFEITSVGLDFQELKYQILDNYNVRPMETVNSAGQVDSTGQEYKTTFCINIDRDHAPMFLILVYLLDAPNNEILAASLIVSVTWTSENMVRLSANPTVQRPNKKVAIGIETEPDSLIGLAGVDESVLLLGEANSVTHDKLREAVDQYRLFNKPSPKNDYPFPVPFLGPAVRQKRDIFPGSMSEVASLNIINNAGLLVLSDSGVLEVNPVYDDMFNRFPVELQAPGNAVADDAVALPEAGMSAGQAKAAEAPTVRKDFSDTILFSLVEIDSSGQGEVEMTCPGRITDWHVSAWSLNDEKGLAAAEDIQVRCYQPFFIALNLPYSIKLGEEFKLQIRIFNYKESPLEVTVILSSSRLDFTLGSGEEYTKSVMVPAGLSNLIELDFIAKRFGSIPITVTATADGISDAVMRQLLVEPPGRELKREMKKIFSSAGASPSTATVNMADIIEFRDIFVEGSLRTYIQVTGDMMGPFIKNLLGSIQMPVGCGEQNMQTVTPSVFTGMYLKAIGRLDTEYKQKVNLYTSKGFFREQVYMHPDGSYSAFGPKDNSCGCHSKRDLSGSGWLTGYVLETFSLVLIHDLGYASADSLSKSFDFLIAQKLQTPGENFFDNPGRVIHTEMQGGSASGSAYSSFILAALIASRDVFDNTHLSTRRKREISQTAATVIEQGCNWLESTLIAPTVKQSQYSKVIGAYTLARCGKYAAAKTILQGLEGALDTDEEMDCPYNYNARDEDVGICLVSCDACGPNQGCCADGPCARSCKTLVPKSKGGPSMTEKHAYRLLAYLFLDDYQSYRSKAQEDLDWLVKNQKSNGAFHSTQDTATAMKAMTWFAMKFMDSYNTYFTVTVTRSGNSNPLTTFNINNVNKIALTTYRDEETSPSSSYTLAFSGTGTAYVTVVGYYNIKTKGDSPTIIDIDYTVTSNNMNSGTVNVCVSGRGTEAKNLGSMVMGRVEFPSGIRMGDVKLTDLKDSIERLEYDENARIFTLYYMTDNNSLQRVCNEIPFIQEIEVMNRQPAKMMAFDYYNEAETVVTKYYTLQEGHTGTTPSCVGATCGCQAASASALLTFALVLLMALRRYLQ